MFTFKTEQPAGKWRSFHKPTYYIKLKKTEIGTIEPDAPHKIRLQVTKTDINEDGNPNCEWKWITLKKEFSSVDEAKLFLKEKFESITKQFNLWKGDQS